MLLFLKVKVTTNKLKQQNNMRENVIIFKFKTKGINAF